VSEPDISHSAEPATAGPAHPTVTVQLSGTDGNAHMIIGKVGAALRREVGNEAADRFTHSAYDCTSFDQVLQLAMATVTVC